MDLMYDVIAPILPAVAVIVFCIALHLLLRKKEE